MSIKQRFDLFMLFEKQFVSKILISNYKAGLFYLLYTEPKFNFEEFLVINLNRYNRMWQKIANNT